MTISLNLYSLESYLELCILSRLCAHSCLGGVMLNVVTAGLVDHGSNERFKNEIQGVCLVQNRYQHH